MPGQLSIDIEEDEAKALQQKLISSKLKKIQNEVSFTKKDFSEQL